MTVQRQFTSWQTNPKQPDPKTCAPIITSWWQYMRVRWGGRHLGCYVRREIRSGGALSSHASGAAFDWRYQDPGPGRARMLSEVMPWLINNSQELGIQAIHDYAGRRIWRPPGCSGRPTSPSPQCGWRSSSIPQMHPTNVWLHIEAHPSRWGDKRSVAQMLGSTPQQPPTQQQPPSQPDQGDFLMALTDQQQADLYNRVMGSLPGPYSTEQRAKNPPPEGRLFALDNADGQYIVSLLERIANKLGA